MIPNCFGEGCVNNIQGIDEQKLYSIVEDIKVKVFPLLAVLTLDLN